MLTGLSTFQGGINTFLKKCAYHRPDTNIEVLPFPEAADVAIIQVTINIPKMMLPDGSKIDRAEYKGRAVVDRAELEFSSNEEGGMTLQILKALYNAASAAENMVLESRLTYQGRAFYES